MGIGTGSAALIGGLGAAGGIGGALIGSSGAQNAANAQAQASEQAAQLQYQAEQQALAQQQLTYGNALQLSSPYYMQGEGALANLSNLLGLPVQGNVVNPAQLPTGANNVTAPNPGALGGNLGWGGRQYPGSEAVQGGQRIGPQSYGNPNLPQNIQGTAQRPIAGTGAQPLSSLINPSLGATGSLMQPWTQQFQAPTGLTMQNDPGYQARLQLGMQAVQNSAAASGDLLSGNTLAGLNQFGQDYASNEYGNVYNRAFNQYAQSYNQFQQNQANQYNRLANLAGLGQTTAQQLGYLGSSSGQGIANTLLGSAGQIGGSLQNAGAARASGYAAGGNIWGNTIGGLGSLGSLLALSQSGNYNNTGTINPLNMGQ